MSARGGQTQQTRNRNKMALLPVGHVVVREMRSSLNRTRVIYFFLIWTSGSQRRNKRLLIEADKSRDRCQSRNQPLFEGGR